MKYNSKPNKICNNNMTFQDCEIAILRNAVDESEKLQGEKLVKSEEIQKIIRILENFILRKKVIIYGGTAINNILPETLQFYNKDIELPDYDFFTPHALEYAKDLVDEYYSKGFKDVEAKSGVHYGTFKVYVNFIPIADITYLHPNLFESLKKESITIAGLYYAPPSFLKMSIYLELSRPKGDVSRWEKLIKRLNIINKFYPITKNINCKMIDFQRKMEKNVDSKENIFYLIRNSLIEQKVVFFGGYASSLYSRYLPKYKNKFIKKIPDFDVISEEPENTSLIIRELLMSNGYKNVREVRHNEIGEIIPERIEICIDVDTVLNIYYPIACHNYNTISIDHRKINVATIDTMLSFYLAFIFTDQDESYKNRILCMANFLFLIQEKNRLKQNGLLKRFTINCIGKQPTIEEIRSEKSRIYNELKLKKNTKDYEMWFLNYKPNEKNIKNKDSDSEENGEEEEEENGEEEEEEEEGEKINEKNISKPKKIKKSKKFKKTKKSKKSKKTRKNKGFLY